MKTLRQSSRSSREMGASDTRLFTPNTTVRRISFRTLQPVGSSTNQVLRTPAGTDFTCSREYTPFRHRPFDAPVKRRPLVMAEIEVTGGADPLEDPLDGFGVGRPAAAAVRGHLARFVPRPGNEGLTRAGRFRLRRRVCSVGADRLGPARDAGPRQSSRA